MIVLTVKYSWKCQEYTFLILFIHFKIHAS